MRQVLFLAAVDSFHVWCAPLVGVGQCAIVVHSCCIRLRCWQTIGCVQGTTPAVMQRRGTV